MMICLLSVVRCCVNEVSGCRCREVLPQLVLLGAWSGQRDYMYLDMVSTLPLGTYGVLGFPKILSLI